MILASQRGGERVWRGGRRTEQRRAVLEFLLMLWSIGQHYHGFETDSHGAKRNEDGVYQVRGLKHAC